MKFSIKFVISHLLNDLMIYGFYSLGGELCFKSQLIVWSFYQDVKFDMFIYEVANLRYGFLACWISKRNIGNNLRKTQIEYVTTKFSVEWENFGV